MDATRSTVVTAVTDIGKRTLVTAVTAVTAVTRNTMTTKQTVSRARVGYQKANEEAAEIVLGNVTYYGGEQAGLVIWARLIEAKSVPSVRGPLFEATGRQAA